MKKITFLLLAVGITFTAGAQNVAITDDNGYTANPSAMLDVKSTTKGMLVPRLTTAQRTAVGSPANGLLVFDTDEGDFYFYNGSSWVNLTSGVVSNLWGQNGNRVFLNDTAYHLGIGTKIPTGKMEVKAGSDIGAETAIFGVVNYNGDTVFAVYPGGVRVLVEDDQAKAGGNKAGFAVGGFSLSKGVFTNNYLCVTPDSVRIYIEDTTGSSKAGPHKAGFAVGGFSLSKGTMTNEYFTVTDATTQVYVSDSTAGFGITNIESGNNQPFMDVATANYFIGHESGQLLTSGLYNSTLGYQSGYNLTSGISNLFIGYQSGYYTGTGAGNLFAGFQAGFSNLEGSYNSFVGYMSGYSNAGGLNNSFLGSFAGHNNTGGSYNTFVGDSAGYFNTTGDENSFYGDKTGLNNTIGSNNVFIGNRAGYSNTEGDSCVFIGNRAGYSNNTGMMNVFFGNRAGYSNTTGEYNIFLGHKAGFSNTTGKNNVFLGHQAGYENLGGGNVFLGFQTGYSNTMGNMNVFMGFHAGYSNINGSYSVFVGKDAGYNNTWGTENLFIGYQAGYSNLTAMRNVFLGYQAGYDNTSGSYNIFIGNQSGSNITTGQNNIFMGFRTGYLNSTGNNNVFLGHEAGYNETGSGRLYIENSNADSTSALIWGNFNKDWVRINDSLGIGRNPETNQLEVEGDASKTTAGNWLANSDKRIKTDIQNIENATETMLRLRPVKFKYTDTWKKTHPSIEDKYYYNFIAQEYQKVFPESVKGSGEYLDGDKEEILQIDTYNAQVVGIRAIQEIVTENQAMKSEIADMKKELAGLDKANRQLKTEIENIKAVLQSSSKK